MMHERCGRRWFRHGRREVREFWAHGGRGWGGPWAGMGRPVRRGEMKFVVLEALLDGPKHGYEIITALEAKRNVRPSAGSIYPTLQMLEDGGFVTSEAVDGKRVYTITDGGRALLEQRAGDDDDDADEAPNAHQRLREATMKLGAAVLNARGSDEATMTKIRDVLDKARKDVYAILAADES